MSLAARIVAIVNRYDNLCNPPPRTAALTPHEAVATLFAQGRSRFDAAVLNAFIRVVGVYPAGSLVQLTDDRYAMVVGVNSSRPLKPRVLVHDPRVPRNEALVIDLERAADLGIRRSLPPARVPAAALAYLDPRPRVSYYFEPLVRDDRGRGAGGVKADTPAGRRPARRPPGRRCSTACPRPPGWWSSPACAWWPPTRRRPRCSAAPAPGCVGEPRGAAGRLARGPGLLGRPPRAGDPRALQSDTVVAAGRRPRAARQPQHPADAARARRRRTHARAGGAGRPQRRAAAPRTNANCCSANCSRRWRPPPTASSSPTSPAACAPSTAASPRCGPCRCRCCRSATTTACRPGWQRSVVDARG